MMRLTKTTYSIILINWGVIIIMKNRMATVNEELLYNSEVGFHDDYYETKKSYKKRIRELERSRNAQYNAMRAERYV